MRELSLLRPPRPDAMAELRANGLARNLTTVRAQRSAADARPPPDSGLGAAGHVEARRLRDALELHRSDLGERAPAPPEASTTAWLKRAPRPAERSRRSGPPGSPVRPK